MTKKMCSSEGAGTGATRPRICFRRAHHMTARGEQLCGCRLRRGGLEVGAKAIFAVGSGRKRRGAIRSGLGGRQSMKEEEGLGEGRSEREGGGVSECSCAIL